MECWKGSRLVQRADDGKGIGGWRLEDRWDSGSGEAKQRAVGHFFLFSIVSSRLQIHRMLPPTVFGRREGCLFYLSSPMPFALNATCTKKKKSCDDLIYFTGIVWHPGSSRWVLDEEIDASLIITRSEKLLDNAQRLHALGPIWHMVNVVRLSLGRCRHQKNLDIKRDVRVSSIPSVHFCLY